jgi:predicted dehydrogenase
VYVEKPFAVDLEETEEILKAAENSGRLVCVGHDQLFDPVWLELRQLLHGGVLGKVVHVDSVQGYDLKGPFGRVAACEPDHWVRRLPGGLFQNTMSHALYKITDLLPDPCPDVWAAWFGSSPWGGPSELRVMLRGKQTTGHLLFTSAARPVQRVARIYGTRGGVAVDFDSGRVSRFASSTLPGPFAKIGIPVQECRDAARSVLRNLTRLLHADLHYFAGMYGLFFAFYRAIAENGPPPIAYDEIRRVTGLMDRIFEMCRGETAEGVRGDYSAARRGVELRGRKRPGHVPAWSW